MYSFSRSVQVAENAPLALDLEFGSQFQLYIWQWAVIVLVLAALGLCLAISKRKPTTA